MNLQRDIKLNAAEVAQSLCADVNAQIEEKVMCLLPRPSAANIQDIIKRTFGQDLQITSISGDYENLTCKYTGGHVHIVRTIGASWNAHKEVIENLLKNAQPGDIMILKSYDLSKGRCFPYHSAFERFMEILSMYNQVTHHPVTHEALQELTKDLPDAIIQMGVPVKFAPGFKTLPITLLECLRVCIEATDAIQMDEFDTVLSELRRIGQDPDIAMRLFTLNRILFKHYH